MAERGEILVGPDGKERFFYEEDLAGALESGWRPAGNVVVESGVGGGRAVLTGEDFARREVEAPASVGPTDPAAESELVRQYEGERDYGGAGQQVLAGAEGLGSALTFGVTDVLGEALGSDVAQRAEFAGTGRAVGETVGVLATALSPFGKGRLAEALVKYTPAGRVSGWAGSGATGVARAGRAAAEGALWGATGVASEVVLQDPEFGAEAFLEAVPEMAKGAILGAIVGGAAQGGVEAVGGIAGRLRQPVTRLTLDDAPAKALVGDFAKVHKEVESVLDSAQGELARRAKEQARGVADEFAQSTRAAMDDVSSAVRAHRQRSPMLDDLGFPTVPVIDPADLKALNRAGAKYTKYGRLPDADAYLERAGNIAEYLDDFDLVERITAHRATIAGLPAAVEGATGFLAKSKALNRSLGRAPFDLPSGMALGPQDFRRLLAREPEDAYKRFGQLSDYYKAARESIADSPLHVARLDAALAEYSASLGRMVVPETAAKLSPQLLAEMTGATMVLGTPGIEGTPVDEIAKGYLALQLLGGVKGVRARSRGLLGRIARGVTTRAGMSAAASAAPGAGLLGGMSRSGSAATAYNVIGSAFDRLTGAKTAAGIAHASDLRIMSAAERLATGKPRSYRTAPFVHKAVDALYNPLDGEPPAKTRADKLNAISVQLARYATAPDAAGAALYDLLRPVTDAVNDVFTDAMETLLHVKFAYLADKAPKDPGTMVMFGRSVWQASEREWYEFGAYAMGALFPLEVIDMIADGVVPPQAAQGLAEASPEAFRKLQQAVIARAPEIAKNCTYAQRLALSRASAVPLDPTADPRYLSFIQGAHSTYAQAAANQTGNAPQAPAAAPEQDYTEAQRLLQT